MLLKIVCAMFLIDTAYLVTIPTEGILAREPRAVGYTSTVTESSSLLTTLEEAKEEDSEGNSDADKNDSDDAVDNDDEAGGANKISAKVVRQAPIFHQTQRPTSTSQSWLFMTMKVEEFRQYLMHQATRNLAERARDDSKKKGTKVDIRAVVEVVRNLTNDYDNENFVSKLNESLLKMDLPSCYSTPLKDVCKRVVLSDVLLVLSTSVSVFCCVFYKSFV